MRGESRSISTQKVAAEIPEEILVGPEGIVPNRPIKTHIQDSYVKLANQLGFSPPELLEKRILCFFADNSLEIYDTDKVMVWLEEKCPKGKTIFWRPLREKDREKGIYPYIKNKSTGSSSKLYEKIVPLRVLEKVAKIEHEFGADVAFFVSEFGRPDPFILVCTNSGIPYIFDYWDEPGFEG